MYKFSIDQMATPAWVQHCTVKNVNGAKSKVYADPDSDPIFCNFKTYGGTEKIQSDQLVILDTATVTTWYDPAIKSSDRIILEDGSIWDIKNSPENLEMRSQFMQFKVQKVGGMV